MTHPTRTVRLSSAILAVVALTIGLTGGAARAALTDISSQPIASTTAAQVKPNVMLLMDASGSMGYTHMPDEVELVYGPTSIGYKSSQCNALYYDPAKTYVLPRRFNGVPFDPSVFANARVHGYGEFYTTPDTTSTTPLGSGFRAYISLLAPQPQTLRNSVTPDPAQPAYYYMHSSGAPTAAQCSTNDSGAPGSAGSVPSAAGGTWTRTLVGAAEQQNFANWYTYYRTRISFLKSAASLAFTPLTDTYRVGFITVSPKGDPHADSGILSDRFLGVKDFDVAQRQLWFTKLFSQTPGGTSPAREGLARVGRYYAGLQDGINTNMPAQGVYDPIQYSCQRNFTIMTTDGYWNAQAESDYTGTMFGGGVRLDGKTKVGQQDGDYIGSMAEGHCPITDPYCRRPVFDGNTSGERTVRNAVLDYSAIFCPLPTTQSSVYHTTQTRSRWTASYERTTRREQYSTEQKTRDRETYTNTLIDKKKIKQTTEQYTETTTTDSYSAYQIRRQDRQSSRRTTTQTAAFSQAIARTYQTEERVTRQARTSVQYVQLRQQTSKVTEQNRQEKRQYTVENFQTEKYVYRYERKLKVGDEGFEPAPDCGSPAIYECKTVVLFRPEFVDPDTCTGDVDEPYPYRHTRCTPTPHSPTPIDTCSNSAAAAPNWIKTVCLDNSVEMPKFVDTCNRGIDASHVRTICTTPPGPNNATITGVDPATCTPSGGSSPDYIKVSCPLTLNETTYPNTACSSGTEAGMIYRSCPALNPATNFTDYPATCLTGTLANNQQVTCAPVEVVSGPTIVDPALCTSGPFNAGSQVHTRSCTPIPAGPYPTETYVASCNASTMSGNPWTTQVCRYPAETNDPNKPVSQATACANVNPQASNDFLSVTCNAPTVVDDFVSPGGCSSADGTVGPGYVKVECFGPVGVGTYATPTLVDPSTCTNNSMGTAPNYVVTECVPNAAAPWPTCANFNSGPPNYIQYVCGTGTTVNAVPSCMIGTTYPSPGVTVVCSKFPGPNNVTDEPVTSCSRQDPLPENGYVRRTCDTQVTLTQRATDSCQPGADANNELELTNCVYDNPRGGAWVDVCSPSGPGSAPNYDRVTCSQPSGTGYNDNVLRPVETCAPGTVYDPTTHIATTCVFTDTGVVPVPGGAAACPGDQQPLVGNGYKTIDCETFASQPPATVPTCAAVPPAGPSWEYKTCTPATPSAGPTLSAPCSNFVDGNELVTCDRALFAGPTTTSCSPGTTVSGVDEIVCAPGGNAAGQQLQSIRTVTTTVYATSGTAPVSTISSSSVSDAPVTYGACAPSVTVPSPATQTAPPDGTCSAWPCVSDVVVAGNQGSKNSLADVANYYYKTDLRSGLDGTQNLPDNVAGPQSPNVEVDSARHQHMTTYVLGLGVSGTLQFHPDYWKPTNTNGDFPAIRSGAKNWPIWPDPNLTYASTSDYEDRKSIDDFWHTAVNGRGRFFNANDTASVVAGLNEVLASTLETPLTGAGDASSTFAPIGGQDDFVYRSTYVPKGWKGDLEAFTQNDLTGNIDTLVWSADALLAPRVRAACDDRKIYFVRGGTALVPFTWNSVECASGSPDTQLTMAEQNLFRYGTDSPANLFSHYPSMTTAQRGAARGENLVNFLRGQKGLENFAPGDVSRLFRKRTSVLGDFVNSQPVYVGKPFARYLEAGYSDFVNNNANRRKMLYVGGNDGMLHAFDAATGEERWAVIPQTVMPNLYKLADPNYDYQHEYYVDGTPVVGDYKDPVTSTWKTMLVVGLNKGGKAYMALDITNPEVPPVPLWEFKAAGTGCSATVDDYNAVGKTDCNLGLTYGKPVITKLREGSVDRWVVLLTSGYNNVNGDGNDGKGFAYALMADSGRVVKKIPTGAGSATTPSGLAQLNNFVDDAFVDNTTLRAYGGDLAGNIWRFEFAPAAVKLLGVAKDPNGVAQPITIRPELAEADGKPMVFVGTGKLLGSTDVTDMQVQSVYGIVDNLDPPSPSALYEPLRSSLVPLKMTQTGYKSTVKRTVACATSGQDCSRSGGWVLDLKSTPPVTLPEGDTADEGERVNVNMQIVFGTLVFASNVPTPDPCTAAGHAYFTYLNWRTGFADVNSPFVNPSDPDSRNSTDFVGDALVAGFNIYKLNTPNGNVWKPISRNVDRSSTVGRSIPPMGPSVSKRISWREIVTQ